MGCYNSEQLPGILIASLTASWYLTINILSILVLNIIISIIILVMVIIIMIITNMMIMTELRVGRSMLTWLETGRPVEVRWWHLPQLSKMSPSTNTKNYRQISISI